MLRTSIDQPVSTAESAGDFPMASATLMADVSFQPLERVGNFRADVTNTGAVNEEFLSLEHAIYPTGDIAEGANLQPANSDDGDTSYMTEADANRHFREDPVAAEYIQKMDDLDIAIDKGKLTQEGWENAYEDLVKEIESQSSVDVALAMAARIRLMSAYDLGNKPDMVEAVARESMEKYPGIVNWKFFKMLTHDIDLS
jgi:polyhydroxyalkanoate synthesis regulator phasin